MKTITMRCFALCFLLALAGCASQPDRVAELDNARAAVQSASGDPQVQRYAEAQLDDAEAALERAEAAWRGGEDLASIRHEAYLATRHAEIAQERATEAELHARIENSEVERKEVLLAARDRDVASAQRIAAERDAAADYANQRAAAATAEAEALAAEIQALKAEQTESGMVFTLGDVLFDTDRAELKPGAQSALDRLAGFLGENPARQVRVEGHTDSTGSPSYNSLLSRDRAQSVADALTARGIAAERLRVRGMGEAYPVATNDTEAGRQENRRVEVVVSGSGGQFPDAAPQ